MADHRTARRALLAAFGALGLWLQPAAAQTKLDLSTVWPESNFHTQNAMRYADEVKKATNGSVEILVKPGGQLGFKGPEHLRAVRDGIVPMADILNRSATSPCSVSRAYRSSSAPRKS
jgi:TRAP-type C4-dicarboxylate transport system substrate-binding protein